MVGDAQMTDVPNHISERLNRSDKRLDGHEERLNQLEKDGAGMSQWRVSTTDTLKGIQGDTKWIVRLIIGALILATISFIVAGGINGA